MEPQTTVQRSTVINYLVAESGPTAGQIVMFAGDYTPTGTLAANGALLQIEDHVDLYYKIGNQYGGDDLTTFALPDLRGRTIIGTGAGAGLTLRSLGEIAGSYTTTLTPAEMPVSVGGGGGTLTNMQPSVALNHGMAYTGIYPQPSVEEAAARISPYRAGRLHGRECIAGQPNGDGWPWSEQE